MKTIIKAKVKINKSENEYIIFYSSDKDKGVYIEKNGYSYFTDIEQKQKYGFFLKQLYFYLKFKKISYDVEANITQKSIETKKISIRDNDDILIEFENSEYYDIKANKININEIYNLFKNLYLNTLPFKIEKQKILINYKELKSFENELKSKIDNEEFIINFITNYFSFIKNSINTNNLEKITLINAMYNFILTRINNFKLERIKIKDIRCLKSLKYFQLIKKIEEKVKNLNKKLKEKQINTLPIYIKIDFPVRGEVLFKKDVIGTIKLITHSYIDDIQPGQIIVISYPQIDDLSIIKKSTGIICESGGYFNNTINYAIKEKKCCITSIMGCTKYFKDGEKIKIKDGIIYQI